MLRVHRGKTLTARQGVLEIAKGAAFLGDDIFVDVFAGVCKLAKVSNEPDSEEYGS